MSAQVILGGTAHAVPEDLGVALVKNAKALLAWDRLTPLARNEWICWTTSGKQEKTRREHIQRAMRELKEGKRRPCCWMGCVHRKEKPLSPTQKWILDGKK
jgi:hypothetical protein